MKILRAVLFSIAGLLMAGCLGILVCALNPSLTEMLAGQVEQMQMAGGILHMGNSIFWTYRRAQWRDIYSA